MTATSKHYDVVVLGTGIGALAAAALLARRSWRVLVLGQGHRKATYAYDGMSLARRAFTFLSASSPAWGRVLVELGQSQTFRRRLAPLDPMLQFLGPSLRLDVPPSTALFGAEIEREFPSVRRVVDDLYAELARTNAAGDAAFEKDVVWPPGGFWERRETRRVLATLPWLDGAGDPLAELARDHPFREVVSIPARFASDLADGMPAFAVARLHGAWTRGVSRLAGGEDELTEVLLERVRAHGGDTRLGERATALLHERGKVRGVVVDGEETVGVTFVVSDQPAGSLLELAEAGAPPPSEPKADLEVAEQRFVVSMVVRSEGLPQPLAAESFILPEDGEPVHLQRQTGTAPGTELLVAEALLAAGAPLARARARLVTTVAQHLPFVERHLLVCDSPHDGEPLWDMRSATAQDTPVGAPAWGLFARPIERARLRQGGASLDAEPMTPRLRVVPPQLSGLAGEPLRTSIGNVLVAGRSTLPALGQEGELLAAWGVARIITRTDRRRQKMLREMWSKVELS